MPKHCFFLKHPVLLKSRLIQLDEWIGENQLVRKISSKKNAAGMNVLVQKFTEMHRWKAYINIGVQKNKGNKQRYCVRVFKVFEVLYFCVLLQGVTLNTPVTLQMWALCNTCQELAATSWGKKNICLYSNLQRILWRLMSGADRRGLYSLPTQRIGFWSVRVNFPHSWGVFREQTFKRNRWSQK